MNKKNIIILVIILVVLVAVAGFILIKYRDDIFNREKNEEQNEQSQTKTENSEIKITDKKITDDTKPFKIDITYPEVAGQNELNKKITDLINSQINDFKTISLENDNAVKQVDPEAYAKYPREYDLNINYTKGEIDENVVSFVFEIYSFTGGAHGATNFVPVNYNLKNKTEIKLADLFLNDPNYIKTVSDFCIKNLTDQMAKSGAIDMTNTDWINRGAGPDSENFQIFLINKNNIVFFFPQYQVAAYAAGNFEVIMPR